MRQSSVSGLLFGMVLSVAPCLAGDKIFLYYNERTPYAETRENGAVEGLNATPAVTAFQRAGISYEWKKAPVSVQMLVLKENKLRACLAGGWFKNPEREKFGKFSVPVYQAKEMVVLALADNQAIANGRPVKDLLQNKQAALLVKEGYSYGRLLDQLISQLNTRTVVATGENVNMLAMLKYKRADYFFLSDIEAQALLERSEFGPADFKVVRFSEPLEQEPRRLWCTFLVSDAEIDRLNVELDKLRAK